MTAHQKAFANTNGSTLKSICKQQEQIKRLQTQITTQITDCKHKSHHIEKHLQEKRAHQKIANTNHRLQTQNTFKRICKQQEQHHTKDKHLNNNTSKDCKYK